MTAIHIADNRSEWVNLAAKFILSNAEKALLENDRFVLALSGGGTPRPLYKALPDLWLESRLSWDRTHIIWSDERCVPPDHPQSNYRMAREVLIDQIDISPQNVHPMYCGRDSQSSAAEYETILQELYADQPWPEIDLCLLGMGTDGHTASLFPGSPAMYEENRWVVVNHTPSVEHQRLTLTLPAINCARSIAFLVTGTDKAETLRQVMQHPEARTTLPAQRIQPRSGQLHWFLDKKAAQYLERQ
jgi:6-phosphogluconolactonase